MKWLRKSFSTAEGRLSVNVSFWPRHIAKMRQQWGTNARNLFWLHELKENIWSLFARIGAINIVDPSVNGITDYEVEEFIVHENYSSTLKLDDSKEHLIYDVINDIGLLKLVQEVLFHSKLRFPACLQQEEFTGGKIIAVSEICFDQLHSDELFCLNRLFGADRGYYSPHPMICGNSTSTWKIHRNVSFLPQHKFAEQKLTTFGEWLHVWTKCNIGIICFEMVFKLQNLF